jgi:all-trans-retinol 13,14-reductase
LIDGEVVECDMVIFSGHPGELLRLTPEAPFRPVYRKRLEALEDSESAVMLAVSCDPFDLDADCATGPGPSLEQGNVYLMGGKAGGEASLDPEAESIYLTPAWRADAPGVIGGFLLLRKFDPEIFTPWADTRRNNRPKEYLDLKKSIAEGLLGRMERSYPHMVGAVRRVQVATPLTFREYTGAANGGVYGVKHRLGQYNPMARTRVGGLYLTGQATALPGVVGAVVSGYMTAGHILGEKTLLDELRDIG